MMRELDHGSGNEIILTAPMCDDTWMWECTREMSDAIRVKASTGESRSWAKVIEAFVIDGGGGDRESCTSALSAERCIRRFVNSSSTACYVNAALQMVMAWLRALDSDLGVASVSDDGSEQYARALLFQALPVLRGDVVSVETVSDTIRTLFAVDFRAGTQDCASSVYRSIMHNTPLGNLCTAQFMQVWECPCGRHRHDEGVPASTIGVPLSTVRRELRCPVSWARSEQDFSTMMTAQVECSAQANSERNCECGGRWQTRVSWHALESASGVAVGCVVFDLTQHAESHMMLTRPPSDLILWQAPYRLLALMLRTGSQAESGHFTAAVRDGDVWTLCDDFSLRTTTLAEILDSQRGSSLQVTLASYVLATNEKPVTTPTLSLLQQAPVIDARTHTGKWFCARTLECRHVQTAICESCVLDVRRCPQGMPRCRCAVCAAVTTEHNQDAVATSSGTMSLAQVVDEYCACSGAERFADADHLHSPDEQQQKAAIESTKRELRCELIGEDEASTLAARSCEAFSNVCLTPTPCAACGVLRPRGDIRCVDVEDDLVLPLKMCASERLARAARLRQLRSCRWADGSAMFVDNGTPYTELAVGDEVYHLDPVGCVGRRVQMCSRCRMSCKDVACGKTQDFDKCMIVAGADFGRVQEIGLHSELSVTERIAISAIRVFDCIIKLTPGTQHSARNAVDSCQCALKGHVISMRHGAASALAKDSSLLSRIRRQLHQSVHVVFIGGPTVWSEMCTNGHVGRVLRIRAKTVIPWLVALSIFHASHVYRELHDELMSVMSDTDIWQAAFDEDVTSLISTATLNDDRLAHIVEANCGSQLHQDLSMEMPGDAENAGGGLHHVYYDTRPSAADHPRDGEAELLRCVQEACFGRRQTPSIGCGNKDPGLVRASVGNAVNEFEDNDELLCGAFPDIFFFGTGVPHNGTVASKVVHDWMNHHTMRFERNPQLLFLLFNQLQRHGACAGVSATVKALPEHMVEFQQLIAAPDFEEQLQQALDDLDKPTSKRLVRQIERLVNVSGRSIPFSSAQRRASLSELYAMIQFYGLPSWFVTISPSDNDSRLVMTLSNDARWATTVDGKLPRTRAALDWELVADYSRRAALLAQNPVAAAKVFSALIETVTEHLFGVPCEHQSRRTKKRGDRRGVLGTTFAFYMPVEAQGRGSLHAHAVVWSGLPPSLLQALATDNDAVRELTEIAAQVLDGMARATLSAERHSARSDDIEKRRERLSSTGPVAYPDAGDPDLSLTEFVETNVANITNYHTHSDTCHKDKHGGYNNVSCRLALPQPICAETAGRTAPIQLEPHERPTDPKSSWLPPRASAVRSQPRFLDRRLLSSFVHTPCPPPDERLVQWELARHGANGDGTDELVVPYNLAISAVSLSNTAVVPLGCSEQAKAVCFYLLKYITKDPNKIEVIRVLLYAALNHLAAHPSTALDSGSGHRFGKHLLQRMLNQAAASQEVSSQMAALALIGKPSTFASDKFWCAFIWPAIRHLQSVGVTCGAHCPDSGSDDDEGNGDDDIELRPGFQAECQDGAHSVGAGQIFDTIDEHDSPIKVVVQQHEHYMHRGKALALLNFYDFVSLVSITRRGEENQTSHRKRKRRVPTAERGVGRDANDIFHFAPLMSCQRTRLHPLHRTHCMRLRSKRLVPVLAGPPPPLIPMRGLDASVNAGKAAQYASYLMTLLCPWDVDNGVPNDGDVSFGALASMMHAWENSVVETEPEISQTTWSGMGCDDELQCKELSVRLQRHRAFVARNISHSLRVSRLRKNVFSMYRYSKAHVWTTDDPMPPGAGTARPRTRSAEDDLADAEAAMYHLVHSVTDVRQRRLDEQRLEEDAVMRLLDSLWTRLDTEVAGRSAAITSAHLREALTANDTLIQTGDFSVQSLVTEMLKPLHESDATPDGNHDTANRSTLPPSERLRELPRMAASHRAPLATEQRLVFDTVVAWYTQLLEFRCDPTRNCPDSLFMLVHGPPGTGKTFLADAIAHVVPCAAGAPTGIAACLFLNGLTLQGLLKIPTEANEMQPLRTAELAMLQRRLWPCCAVLLDEVSFISPRQLAHIDARLREVFGEPSQRFGGMSVIMFGDFFQLPAIPQPGLYKALIQLHEGTLKNPKFTDAISLFGTVQKYELSAQMRSVDPEHTRWLNQMRSPTHSVTPITKEMLAQCSLLSTSDADSDAKGIKEIDAAMREASELPAGASRDATIQALRIRGRLLRRHLWALAPIAVTANALRQRINIVQMTRFAKLTAQPVLVWHYRFVANLPSTVEQLLRKEFEGSVIGQFVAGAPAMLLNNINTEKKLANGTELELHSICFDHEEDRQRVEQALTEWRLRGAEPGERVLVPTPTSINVAVPSIPATDRNIEERVTTAQCLVEKRSDDGVIIRDSSGKSVYDLQHCVVVAVPLASELPSCSRKKYAHITLRTPSGSRKICHEYHPVTPTFACTYHKLQGQTLSKLVLDLRAPSTGTLTLPHVYVGWSRVRRRANLRSLPAVAERTPDRARKHLLKMTVDKDLTKYLHGFNHDGDHYHHVHD